jgi:hypothetical protein
VLLFIGDFPASAEIEIILAELFGFGNELKSGSRTT